MQIRLVAERVKNFRAEPVDIARAQGYD